jgi:hypothetical protein
MIGNNSNSHLLFSPFREIFSFFGRGYAASRRSIVAAQSANTMARS